jgi:major membrane immunogen (membrane-anchored lipoprotein)
MKKLIFISLILLLAAFTGDQTYKDGKYTGISRSVYTSEPYYGNATITIENGKITGVEFFVRDSLKHEYFDDNYERYFSGTPLYISQCRNDRHGVRSYPDSLLKRQDINKVDVISGATWSYNIFKASVQQALSAAITRDK